MAKKKLPAVKVRLIWTFVVGFAGQCIMRVHDAVRGPLDAQIAVGQLNDSVVEYTFIQLWLGNSLVPTFLCIAILAVLLAVWWKHLVYLKNKLS